MTIVAMSKHEEIETEKDKTINILVSVGPVIRLFTGEFTIN